MRREFGVEVHIFNDNALFGTQTSAADGVVRGRHLAKVLEEVRTETALGHDFQHLLFGVQQLNVAEVGF